MPVGCAVLLAVDLIKFGGGTLINGTDDIGSINGLVPVALKQMLSKFYKKHFLLIINYFIILFENTKG